MNGKDCAIGLLSISWLQVVSTVSLKTGRRRRAVTRNRLYSKKSLLVPQTLHLKFLSVFFLNLPSMERLTLLIRGAAEGFPPPTTSRLPSPGRSYRIASSLFHMLVFTLEKNKHPQQLLLRSGSRFSVGTTTFGSPLAQGC